MRIFEIQSLRRDIESNNSGTTRVCTAPRMLSASASSRLNKTASENTYKSNKNALNRPRHKGLMFQRESSVTFLNTCSSKTRAKTGEAIELNKISREVCPKILRRSALSASASSPNNTTTAASGVIHLIPAGLPCAGFGRSRINKNAYQQAYLRRSANVLNNKNSGLPVNKSASPNQPHRALHVTAASTVVLDHSRAERK